MKNCEIDQKKKKNLTVNINMFLSVSKADICEKLRSAIISGLKVDISIIQPVPVDLNIFGHFVSI